MKSADIEVEIIQNVKVQDIEGYQQFITVYRPVERSAPPGPALLYVHGGGFQNGHQDEGVWVGEYLAREFGMTTFSTSYRLATAENATFPQPVQDVADAWRWVQANAEEWGIDKERVGIGGSSAGGMLSTLVPLTSHLPHLAGGGQIPGDEIRPAFILDYWGPLDFIARWFDNGESPGAEAVLLGCAYEKNPTLYHMASPLNYVREGLPPTLFLYGKQDPVVHPRQAQLGAAAWRAYGNRAEVVMVDNIGHGVVGDNLDSRLAQLRHTGEFIQSLL
ncbi:alpha/beta hydrolase [Kiritimatiellaeota bacterium B1221]|nr:alpha/beta hydrolase [Kiritimatiellaeota bacterium B1221]